MLNIRVRELEDFVECECTMLAAAREKIGTWPKFRDAKMGGLVMR